jgi:antitoxin ParD1/3/4
MTTQLALSQHLEGFIQRQVESGRYSSASEVVGDGLRLLEQQQRLEAAKLASLRRAAAEGFDAIDAGHFAELDPDQLDAYLSALGEPTAEATPTSR